MAEHSSLLFIFLMLICLQAETASNNIAAVLDSGKSHISILVGTPPQKQLLHLDLEAVDSFLLCDKQPTSFRPSASSTYTSLPCTSNLCSKRCSGKTHSQCQVPITNKTSVSVFLDVVNLNRSDAKLADKVILGCVEKYSLGVAAMSRSKLSLPLQLASSRKIPHKFTICHSPNSPSPLFFGDDSSFVVGGINISNYVSFVPFVSNPVYPYRYYLGLEKVRVDSVDLPLPPSLFAIDPKTGLGGLKLSSTDRYSKLATPAFSAIVKAFKSYASTFNISVAPPVPPLQVCFNSTSFNFNRLGPVVPVIELVFGNVSWSFGGSSSVEFFGGVGCLAFMDAGAAPVTSTIGLFQQFDNLLHFDVGGSRFGFVDRSLHILRQNCGSFLK